MYQGDDFKFYQDNDPKHKSNYTMSYLEQSGVPLVNPPPQSPDINPIEHIWSIIEKRIRRDKRLNLRIFKECMKQWREIPKEYLMKLVESMRRRLLAVIHAKGYHTRY